MRARIRHGGGTTAFGAQRMSWSARSKPTGFAKRPRASRRFQYAFDELLWQRYRSGGCHARKPADQSGTGALIFPDADVISETLRRKPGGAVTAWLVRNDAELALPTVMIAEFLAPPFCRPDLRRHGSSRAGLWRDHERGGPRGLADDRARRNDCSHCAHQRGAPRDAEPAALRHDRSWTDMPVGFLAT